MNSEKEIKCRKCGGNHLTIKCGSNNISQIEGKQSIGESTKHREVNFPVQRNKNTLSNYENIKPIKNFERTKREYNNKTYRVKINNLPVDINFSELSNLLKDWGHVSKINIKNFTESSYAIIEFQYENEQLYFIEALHSTPFQHQIITVEKLDNL